MAEQAAGAPKKNRRSMTRRSCRCIRLVLQIDIHTSWLGELYLPAVQKSYYSYICRMAQTTASMISSELLRFLRRYWGRLLLLLLLVWVYTGFRFRTPDREAIASFKAEGVALKTGYFARHGKQLHYAQVGDDTRLPLLVFIHGTPGSWADFKAIMKDGSLRARYRMVSVDRPGFGFSDFGEALPMQEQVVLLAALLEELRQGQSVYLAGHSLGGPVAAWLAAEYPQWVQAICIIAGSLSPAHEPAETWRYYLQPFPLRYLLPGAFRPSNEELVFFKKDVVQLAGKLRRIACPVWIVHATDDMFVPVENVAFMKNEMRLAPYIRDTILPDGNHFLPFNRVPLVCRLLLEMARSDR